MLPSESPIFTEQDDIYIYFFTAYGWPVRLEIQNPFFGPKSARVTKGWFIIYCTRRVATGSHYFFNGLGCSATQK